VYFDGGGTGDCQINAVADCASFTMTSGYSGSWDNVIGYNFTVADGGNMTLAGTGTFNFGAGDFYLSNSTLDISGQSTITQNANGTIHFSNNCTIYGSLTQYLPALQVETGALLTIPAAEYVYHYGNLYVYGEIAIGSTALLQTTAADTAIFATGEISGAGTYKIQQPGNGKGLITFPAGAVLSVATFWWNGNDTHYIPIGGAYNSTLNRFTATDAIVLFRVNAGNISFSGSVEISKLSGGSVNMGFYGYLATSISIAGDLDFITNTANDLLVYSNFANWNIGGSMVYTDTAGGDLVYNKGTGTITFNGTGTSHLDIPDPLEDIVVDMASGGLVFDAAVDCESLTVTNGSLDTSGFALTTGNVTFGVGTTAADYSSSTITMTGSWNSSASTISPTYTLSTVNMSGSGVSLITSTTHNNFYNLNITAGSVAVSGSGCYTFKAFNLSAGASCSISTGLICTGNCDIAGDLSGSSNLYLDPNDGGSPGTVGISGAGTITCNNVYFYPRKAAAVLRPATYAPSSLFYVLNIGSANETWTLSAGTYVFDCVTLDLAYANGSGNLTLDWVNNPTVEATGNVSIHDNIGTVIFTNVSGSTLRFIGADNAFFYSDSTAILPNVEVAKVG